MRTVQEAPVLLEELKKVRVVTPEKVTLICRISLGIPTSEVQWYRDKKKIFDGYKYEITMDGDTMSLMIATSEVTDSAIYRCEAFNESGSVFTECRVVVLGMFRNRFISIPGIRFRDHRVTVRIRGYWSNVKSWRQVMTIPLSRVSKSFCTLPSFSIPTNCFISSIHRLLIFLGIVSPRYHDVFQCSQCRLSCIPRATCPKYCSFNNWCHVLSMIFQLFFSCSTFQMSLF